MSRTGLIAGVATALIACAGCGNDDNDGTPGSGSATGQLFSLASQAGRFESAGGDAFKLTLTNPAGRITWFTDRPVRSAGSESIADFVDRWKERGFEGDPPNAALVIDAAPEEADTTVVELTGPSYDQATGAVSFTARQISDGATAALPDADVDPADFVGSFTGAELFIDSAPEDAIHTVELVLQSGCTLKFNGFAGSIPSASGGNTLSFQVSGATFPITGTYDGGYGGFCATATVDGGRPQEIGVKGDEPGFSIEL